MKFTKTWLIVFGLLLVIFGFLEISQGIDVLPDTPQLNNYSLASILLYIPQLAGYLLQIVFYTTSFPLLNILFDIFHVIALIEIVAYVRSLLI